MKTNPKSLILHRDTRKDVLKDLSRHFHQFDNTISTSWSSKKNTEVSRKYRKEAKSFSFISFLWNFSVLFGTTAFLYICSMFHCVANVLSNWWMCSSIFFWFVYLYVFAFPFSCKGKSIPPCIKVCLRVLGSSVVLHIWITGCIKAFGGFTGSCVLSDKWSPVMSLESMLVGSTSRILWVQKQASLPDLCWLLISASS